MDNLKNKKSVMKITSSLVAALTLNCPLKGLTDFHLRLLNTNGKTPAVHRFCQ